MSYSWLLGSACTVIGYFNLWITWSHIRSLCKMLWHMVNIHYILNIHYMMNIQYIQSIYLIKWISLWHRNFTEHDYCMYFEITHIKSDCTHSAFLEGCFPLKTNCEKGRGTLKVDSRQQITHPLASLWRVCSSRSPSGGLRGCHCRVGWKEVWLEPQGQLSNLWILALVLTDCLHKFDGICEVQNNWL